MVNLNKLLFKDDRKKIEESVVNHNFGSYQLGEVSRLSSSLYDNGVNVVKALEDLQIKYRISE